MVYEVNQLMLRFPNLSTVACWWGIFSYERVYEIQFCYNFEDNIKLHRSRRINRLDQWQAFSRLP